MRSSSLDLGMLDRPRMVHHVEDVRIERDPLSHPWLRLCQVVEKDKGVRDEGR
jgi:hypothetical protein